MDEKIFDRVEKKYVINKDQKAEIMRVINKKMSKGKYH